MAETDERYSRGKIYMILSLQSNNIYVGSTIETLERRFSKHRYDRKIGKAVSSCVLMRHDDAFIQLLENFPCKNKKQLEARGPWYISMFKDHRMVAKGYICVNKSW